MSEVEQRTKQEVVEIAGRRGLVCIFPQADEILLDVDYGPFKLEMEKMLETLGANGYAFSLANSLTTASTGGNKHVYLALIALRPGLELTPAMRVVIQTCLGSDPKREFLSMLRIVGGAEEGSEGALFETAEEAKRVEEWRERRRPKRKRFIPKKRERYIDLKDDVPF
jgi:hypothetical protein